jgi:hypothetical protein
VESSNWKVEPITKDGDESPHCILAAILLRVRLHVVIADSIKIEVSDPSITIEPFLDLNEVEMNSSEGPIYWCLGSSGDLAGGFRQLARLAVLRVFFRARLCCEFDTVCHLSELFDPLLVHVG